MEIVLPFISILTMIVKQKNSVFVEQYFKLYLIHSKSIHN